MQETFIAAIMSGHLPDPKDWQSWFSEQIGKRSVALLPSGEMTVDDMYLGNYQFHTRDQAKSAYGMAPWFSLEQRGPWLGRPAGFFAWSHLGCQDEAESFLLPALVDLARGFCARMDDNRSVQFAIETNLPLSNLVGRHGFQDGNAFLDRAPDSNYMTTVVRDVRTALDAQKVDVFVGLYGSHHNPLRITGEVKINGQPIDDAWTALDRIEVMLWVLNWNVLDEISFWLE